ncbi:MAG: hypothetical protein QM532_02465 [Cyanobium sp. MAG06]|nr:hypothetical protein [Cyanobium sp. MAG06]
MRDNFDIISNKSAEPTVLDKLKLGAVALSLALSSSSILNNEQKDNNSTKDVTEISTPAKLEERDSIESLKRLDSKI